MSSAASARSANGSPTGTLAQPAIQTRRWTPDDRADLDPAKIARAPVLHCGDIRRVLPDLTVASFIDY